MGKIKAMSRFSKSSADIADILARMPGGDSSIYAYVRVSCDKQTAGAQLTEILAYCLKHHLGLEGQNITQEVPVRGTVPWRERSGLKHLIESLCAEDCLIVSEISRLSRDMAEISEITDMLHKRGVIVIEVRTDRVLDGTADCRLMTSVYAFFSQKEREYISRRTKTGLANAKARGVQICVRKQPRISKLDAEAQTWLLMESVGKTHKSIGEAAGTHPSTVSGWLDKRHTKADGLLEPIAKCESESRIQVLAAALEIGPSKSALAAALLWFQIHDQANHAAALEAVRSTGRPIPSVADAAPTARPGFWLEASINRH
jgi:DNA invertase Pin-like site-specific DNA recombinase